MQLNTSDKFLYLVKSRVSTVSFTSPGSQVMAGSNRTLTADVDNVECDDAFCGFSTGILSFFNRIPRMFFPIFEEPSSARHHHEIFHLKIFN